MTSAEAATPNAAVQAWGGLREQFPALGGAERLSYLDSAASCQRPLQVIAAEGECAAHHYANVHRGVHRLSQEATERYEGARATVANFIGARKSRELVFVRGTTEAINLVSACWARTELGPGDEIVVSELEHHSNLLPWQAVCRETGARIVPWRIEADGTADLDALASCLSERTRLVAVCHISNALGTVVDLEPVTAMARAAGSLVLVDGAQAVGHRPVDVQALGCDFYAFSAHKMYGPSGIGALWAREEILDDMPPWQTGGGMVEQVTLESATFAPAPMRFEAGTPNITGAVGMAAAVRFLEELSFDEIEAREQQLTRHLLEVLGSFPQVRVLGTPTAGVVSFVVDGVHPHDAGTVLDQRGVAVRAGHHCAQPLMRRLGVPATTRASLGVYNDVTDLERLRAGLQTLLEVFA